ncbi:hypothetical protein C1C97_000450 [Kocuria tytonis]|uniref:Uncharacterized protein n=1 Tax=Kocuria tytonis TaxID=2054280 RepID=A0A495A847_9MICC|nr:hypothetical protein C1C97_000450 [Kocuria tytonis]
MTIEPTGNKAGRVTLATSLASLVPPLFAVVVVIACYLVGILSAEAAATCVLAVLATAGLTTGAVFTTGKKTPTDQVRTVSEVVTVPQQAPAPEAVAVPEGTGGHRAAAGSTAAETTEAVPDLAPVVTETTVEVP